MYIQLKINAKITPIVLEEKVLSLKLASVAQAQEDQETHHKKQCHVHNRGGDYHYIRWSEEEGQ